MYMSRGVVMKLLAATFLMLAFATPLFAQSVPPGKNFGTTIVACTSGSTNVLSQDTTYGFRDFLMYQCTGANNCYCCLGTGNNCTTTNGTLLASGGVGSVVLVPIERAHGIFVPAPIADLACCGSGGTSVVSGLTY
jgi:hypothetical protein